MNWLSIKRITSTIFVKYFIIILIVLSLIILGGGYYLFIQDKMTEIQKVGLVDLQSRLNKKDATDRTLVMLEMLNDDYNKLNEDQLQKLGSILPKKSEIPFLVIEIQNFIKDNELILGSIDVGPLSTLEEVSTINGLSQNTFEELNITLSISGIDSYSKLKDFLDSLSEQLPIIELTSLNYVPGNETYSLNLTTYYQ
ncbi:MAG: type 4a pilus biogenesis protein PilO [Candidatus Kerfeldbacteria bacterium]